MFQVESTSRVGGMLQGSMRAGPQRMLGWRLVSFMMCVRGVRGGVRATGNPRDLTGTGHGANDGHSEPYLDVRCTCTVFLQGELSSLPVACGA